MADLSHLSDDELDAKIKAQSPNLGHMSDQELDQAIARNSPPPSAMASGARQALSGFAGNFDDELSGAVSAAGRVAGVKNLGTWKPFNPDSHLETTSPTLDPQELAKSYQENRDLARNEQHKDIEAHPVVSTVANTAGMIANPLLRAASPAGMGAIQGAGNSEAEDFQGLAKDTAVGAGLGYAGGKLAGAASDALAPKLGTAAEALAEHATGAPEQASGMGRELLDKGMVGFGDTQPQVAEKLANAPQPKDLYDPFMKKAVTKGTDFSGLADAAKDAKVEHPGFDIADAGLMGAAMSHPFTAIPTILAKKVALPRAISSLASTANGLSQVLEKNPQALGKWAPVLSQAAQRGENSVNAAAYVLQQRDPEFRQRMQGLSNGGDQSNND